jgi:hypothetical protein
MTKAIMVVLTNPVDPSRDRECNAWYDRTHVPEVCALPGFVGARRYRLSDAQLIDGGAHRYCAVYEIESEDIPSTVSSLAAATEDGRVVMSDVLCMDPLPAMTVWEMLPPAQTGSGESSLH